MVIDGKKIANKIVRNLKRKRKPNKKLVAVLIGNNKASVSFLKQKARVAKILGVEFEILRLNNDVSFQKLEQVIGKLNKDKKVGGIIIQLPLPKKFDFRKVVSLLNFKKDVDVLGMRARILAPTAGAVNTILKRIKFSLKGKNVVLVGRGFLVGQPIARYLRPKVNKLTITDKDKLNKKALNEADLIIVGVGKPNLIKSGFIKDGVVLMDFGYSKVKGKIKGDIDFEKCKMKAKYITPTPGGTGPIVVAQVFENFFKLN